MRCRRLALWAERFSPSVAIDELAPGFEGLFLDITGAAHLFGGEPALLAELRGRLKAAGIPACLAIADTPGRRLGAGALLRPGGDDRARRPHARGDRAPAGRGPDGSRPRRFRF